MIYISGQVRCTLHGISYIVSKQDELWSTNGFELEVRFHPPSVNSAFHFIARLCRRRSANGTQPNFAKRWTVEKLGSCLSKKLGAEKFYICWVFQSGQDVGKYERSYYTLPKISLALVHKRLNARLEFLPTITMLLCPSPSYAMYSVVAWQE